MFLAGQMLFASKWMFHEEYNASKIDLLKSMVEKLEQKQIDKKSVVAMGNSALTMYGLNYYTNQSIIYFHNQTIEDLYNQKKLREAFENFNVEYVIGYSDELNAMIAEKSDVEIIK